MVSNLRPLALYLIPLGDANVPDEVAWYVAQVPLVYHVPPLIKQPSSSPS